MRPSWGHLLGVFFVSLLVSSFVVASESSVSRAAVPPVKHPGLEPMSSTPVVWDALVKIYVKGIFHKTVYFTAHSRSRTKDGDPFNIDHIGFESTIKAYDNLGWHVIHRGRSEQWNGWYVTESWSDGAHYERYIATTNHWFEDARFQNWYPTLTASAER